jgi:predicted dehydrogenase
LNDLLDDALDGVVIATPSALHAVQTRTALERGLAVFCQKPLARTRAEVEALVTLARRQDRLLAVDLSYRFVRAFETLRQFTADGGVGELRAIDLTFHNAYGPDKPWYYTRTLSGGGCVLDLGIHLADLLLRLCDGDRPTIVASQLFCDGVPWDPAGDQVEDLAFVQLELASGGTARLACSWRLPAGCDAVIGASVYGSHAGVQVRNIGGSFYDFSAERLDRGGVHLLTGPPDDWGGRAVMAWARQLAGGIRFDPACEDLIALAGVMDDIYAAAGQRTRRGVRGESGLTERRTASAGGR